MTKHLLIYFDYQSLDKASWISTDSSGAIEHIFLNHDFAELKSFSTDYDVTVIIPGEEVLLTEVTLPKMNRQRLLQAIPYALEEKLIDDIHHLHFALGDPIEDSFPVAVIAKHKMECILAALKNVGISPKRMLPATLALPFTAEKTTVCELDEQCIVRTGLMKGFVCGKANLNLYLEPQIQREEISLTKQDFLEKLHDWVLMQSTFNLLQGPYQSKQKKTFTKKIWQLSLVLGVCWIVLAFINNIVSYMILHKATHNTELAIHAIYKKHFKEATSVVAPRERMESKLKKIMNESNKNDLFNVLGFIGNSLNKTPNISLKNFDFRDNRFNLTVLSSSGTSLDEFSKNLSKQGVNVKQQSADMSGTQMKANLIINRGVS